MSIRLMTSAWSLDLRSTVKLVLLALADNASDEGACFPLISTIAKKCCLSERATQSAITDLENAGHITRQYRLNRSTVYRVHPRVQDMHPPPQQVHPEVQQVHPEVQQVHPTPAAGAPRGAPGAPITVSYPSFNHHSSSERVKAHSAGERGIVSHNEREQRDMTALMARRPQIGLADFRDPHGGESSDDYRKAQDVAWHERREQQRQSRPSSVEGAGV